MNDVLKIALIGNPNCGKSSLFNVLTGLSQKIGNFPGVTVEKKTGVLSFPDHEVKLIDFPGTYSLYPNSLDERIVVETLVNPAASEYPDAIVYVTDSTKLDNQTLLLTQLIDLGFPILWVLNMSDEADRQRIKIDARALSNSFGVDVLRISSKTGEGVESLRKKLTNPSSWKKSTAHTFYKIPSTHQQLIADAQLLSPSTNTYATLLNIQHSQWLPHIKLDKRQALGTLKNNHQFTELNEQVKETMARFDRFSIPLKKAIARSDDQPETSSDQADRILTHQLWGPLIFISLMILVFQAIFTWATYPMDWIEGGFDWISKGVNGFMPAEFWLTDLITNGIIPGVAGVLVFIPQIAILFLLIGLLEEVGYMARVALLWDRLMQFFGLNGRSVVSLISGGACAIPAIMSARTIANRKERLITILVTPFISCNARIPVYAVLIGFVVPSVTVLGIFNLQGLAFMGLYLLGILGVALVALILKFTIKEEEQSMLVLEMPPYRMPVLRNVLLNVWNKVSAFIREAGKIIFVISIILWFAASFGPGDTMAEAAAAAQKMGQEQQLSEEATADLVAAAQLESSYAGRFGKVIEPVIRPLGYDWKIGIALLTSFAAREVFVGTMATIYNIGSSDDEIAIKKQMAREKFASTGQPVYTVATSMSLLIFYVFALQCMATLVVIKKETGGWKWAMISFFIALGIAYFGALMTYQLLS